MSWRLFALLLLCALALATNVVLLKVEELAPAHEQQRETEIVDRHAGRSLTPGERRTNLHAWGFDDAQVLIVEQNIKGLVSRYRMDDPDRSIVRARLSGAEEQNGLREAFCGVGSTGTTSGPFPARYEAMKYLVSEKGGQRDAINLDAEPLKYQDWVQNSRISTIYENAELVAKPHDDATRMAFAAVMAGTVGETDFIERRGGWNDGVWGVGQSWDWNIVKARFPGVELRVLNYVALFLLVAEDAHQPTSTLCPG